MLQRSVRFAVCPVSCSLSPRFSFLVAFAFISAVAPTVFAQSAAGMPATAIYIVDRAAPCAAKGPRMLRERGPEACAR